MLLYGGIFSSSDAIDPIRSAVAAARTSAAKQDALSRLRTSDEFLRFNARGALCLEHFGIVGAYYGEELQRQFALFQQLVAELG